MHNLFDGTFNGMAGSEMYRAQLVPDLFPKAKPMLVDNWSDEDREMYCGGQYVKGAA
ncbi:hypothetical protein KIV65_gp49 [Mycobacterium phage Anthony]|uniref:Uncharacterized protein n=1 Tax=Mycobacterium phage Anthony TaxID=2599857 RepID=A0A5J6TKU4_9CAUD|nr:hypothetical protein KIV65_gp49 [Mycobacterium phage Anthony]QFG10419.1 hypothetical protein PBI_ANTHONY_48 [Mycobacterium phage Anthony]